MSIRKKSIFMAAAVLFSATSGNAEPTYEEALKKVLDKGKELYATNCMACHQAEGQGVPGAFPPLAESVWATGSKERIIKIVLHGIQGEIEVKGQKYNSVMIQPGIPPGSLNDEQLALILTFVRKSWGNEAATVTTKEVAAVRDATKDQQGYYDPAKLLEEHPLEK